MNKDNNRRRVNSRPLSRLITYALLANLLVMTREGFALEIDHRLDQNQKQSTD